MGEVYRMVSFSSFSSFLCPRDERDCGRGGRTLFGRGG